MFYYDRAGRLVDDPTNHLWSSLMLSSEFGMSPAQSDLFIRQAIQMCWLALPPTKKNPGEVRAVCTRLLERALKDFEEDSELFLSE
jgi:hypothetical protein